MRLIISVLLATACVQAGSFVAPAGLGGTEGSNSFGGIIYDLQQTAQMLIPVAYLSGLNNGDQLTGLQFRLDSSQSNGPATAYNYSNFDLTLSQPSATLNMSFDAAFTGNIGADAVLVRSGPMVIAANSYPAGGSPNQFGPLIAFTTPYTYQGGDLLITMRILSTDFLQTGLILDAEFVVQGGTLSGAAYNGTNSSSSAGYIPVMQFQVGQVQVDNPVPEPSTFALALMGLGALMFKMRK